MGEHPKTGSLIMKSTKMILSVFALSVALAATAAAQTLTSLDGEKVNLQGQSGKVVVLAVGASWLPLSKEQTTVVAKLQKKYADKEVAFFFIATDSVNPRSKNYASDDQLRAFGAKYKMTADILRDSDGLLTLKKFAVDQLPSFVILDKTGKMVGEPFGGIDTESDVTLPISKVIDKAL